MTCVRVREWLMAILVALCMTACVNAPIWYYVIVDHEWHWNDVVIESGDELYYLTRIDEVANGYPSIGNPVIAERRSQKGNATLWENILALPMLLWGWRIKSVAIVADGLFPFLLAFMLWVGLRRSFVDQRWRLAIASLIFLGTNTAVWKRPISPQATTLLLVPYLCSYVSPDASSKKHAMIRASLIGLMFYSYPYHWYYTMIAEGIHWIHQLLKQGLRNCMKGVQQALLPIALCTCIAIPWLWDTIHAAADPAHAETLQRLGVLARHLPTAPLLQAKVLALLTGLMVVRKEQRNHRLILLLSAAMITLWTPIITGKEVEFSNHFATTFLPIIAMSIGAIAMSLVRSHHRREQILLIALAGWIFIVTLGAIKEDMKTFRAARPSDNERIIGAQELAALDVVPPSAVILTENSFALRMMTYTAHSPFTAYEAYLYEAPTEDIVLRARAYNTLVPSEPLSARGVLGTQCLNEALHARSLCGLSRLIPWLQNSCQNIREKSASCDTFSTVPSLSVHQSIDVLKNAHVTYAFLHDVPRALRPFATTIRSIHNGRTLYQLSL